MKRVAIITGCAKGIGKEIALSLARDGYDIVGTYNSSDISSVQRRINSIGVKGTFYKLDLRDFNSIEKFYNEVSTKYSHVDILVNNAALSIDNEIEYKTKDEFMNVLEVNLVAPFLLVKKFKNIMDQGIVINISSTDGIDTYQSLNIDYSASKAGLINLTKSLSLAISNIKFYVICPNWVSTESVMEMNPEYLEKEMNRIGQYKLIDPKEVALKILFLIDSDYKSGSVIVMEG